MQSADAATPAPTYGTPPARAGPERCRPRRTGRAGPGARRRRRRAPRAGIESASTGSSPSRCAWLTALLLGRARAPSGRRGRSRSSSSRSAPGRAPRAPSGPTRARPRARSSGRPRGPRPGAPAHGTGRGRGRGRRRAASCGVLERPTTSVTVVPCSRRCRPPGPARARGRPGSGRRRSPRPPASRSRTARSCARASAAVWLVTSGTCEVCGPHRDLERDHGSLALLRARGRVLADHCPFGRGILGVLARDLEAGALELDCGAREGAADHVRHRSPSAPARR